MPNHPLDSRDIHTIHDMCGVYIAQYKDGSVQNVNRLTLDLFNEIQLLRVNMNNDTEARVDELLDARKLSV